MLTMDEDIDRSVLQAVNTVKNNLSILIISKDSFGIQLQKSLDYYQESRNLDFTLSFHVSDSIGIILKAVQTLNIHFVVFLIDLKNDGCCQEVERCISHLNDTLLHGRTCLVRHYAGFQRTSVTEDEVLSLCEKYGLHLLVENLASPEKMDRLAARLVRLLQAAWGAGTGMPFYTGYLSVFTKNNLEGGN